MWSAIKKALNPILGRKPFYSLDALSKKAAYENYYKMAKMFNYENEEKVDEARFQNALYPPETTGELDIWQVATLWIPYGATKIINRPSGYYSPSLLVIPETVTEISEDTFAGIYNIRVIIDNKKGNILGHPWGHNDESKILYLKD